MTFKNPLHKSDARHLSLARVFLLCLGVIAVFIAVDLAVFAQGASFKREGGGLENVSAFLYLVAVAVFLVMVPSTHLARLAHLPLLLVFFALRELDFDKAFTSSGVLSARLYSGDSPLLTKLIAGAVALLFVATVVRTVIRGAPAVLRALRAGESWPWFAAAAGGVVVFTKSIDGLGRKLLDFGIVISDDLGATAALVEEVGEAFIPVLIILAIVARWRNVADDEDLRRNSPAH
jgi:hypothetical protein